MAENLGSGVEKSCKKEDEARGEWLTSAVHSYSKGAKLPPFWTIYEVGVRCAREANKVRSGKKAWESSAVILQ